MTTLIFFVQLTISDGKHSLSLCFHPRLWRLIDSGVLADFAIIWASDISENNETLTLLDADEAAPNPEKIIDSPTLISMNSSTLRPTDSHDSPSKSTEMSPMKERRSEKGLPATVGCHNKTCNIVPDDFRQCSQCKFVG